MSDGPEEEETTRSAGEEIHPAAEYAPAGRLHQIKRAISQINGRNLLKKYEGMQTALNEQKEAMKKVDLDKMMDVQDEMLDMKIQTDMMNEMMNRNYDVDIDEEEFEDEFMEFEREVAQEKKKNVNIGKKQEIKGM